MAKVRIVRDRAHLVDRVHAPYDQFGARQDTIKSMGFRWQPEGKTWIYQHYSLYGFDRSTVAETLSAFLRHDGDTVTITYASSPVQHTRTQTDWATALFAALTPELGEQAYRALSRVLHPDTGGDGRQQQVLNDAWSRVRPKAGAR